ncbi:hypothetical protein DBR19_08715 [Aeromonas sp. HMWF014]|nr:hypothetical protein DBR19_08715 [Aeromonas sp. HMWF014]
MVTPISPLWCKGIEEMLVLVASPVVVVDWSRMAMPVLMVRRVLICAFALQTVRYQIGVAILSMVVIGAVLSVASVFPPYLLQEKMVL